MKRAFSTLASGALVAAALGVSSPATTLASETESQVSAVSGWTSLVGTWTSEITHVDCVSGSPTNPPVFQGHESFHLGGTYTQFGAGLGNRRSTGFGAWRRTGKNTFAASFTFFGFDNATGAMPTAIVKIDRRITMAGPNELSSVNKSTITTLGGIPIATACATETGVRF
jgi:hypothetical protein